MEEEVSGSRRRYQGHGGGGIRVMEEVSGSWRRRYEGDGGGRRIMEE